ncbi:MAG: YceI family protein [Deltaproteobacteria bacterium]|nr:YceI family protein [Deltaproteobacteria bacterium]
MRCRIAFLLVAMLAGPAFADDIQGNCDVRFLATSTLHDFTGTARSRPFTAPLSMDAAGRRSIPIVEVLFPVSEIRTGNASRDVKMREMFQADRYPVIRAVGRDVDAETFRDRMRKDSGGKTPIEATLVIRDVERKVRAEAGNWREEGDRISFDVEFPLSLKEFGLKPPSVLGFIRVGDRIVVKGTVALTVRGAHR